MKFVPKRRKKEGKTDYKKRLKLLKSNKTRLVIRRKSNSIIIQFVEYSQKGDKVLQTTSAQQLDKTGWKGHKGNICSAYLTGLLSGTKAKNNIKEAILDTGLHKISKGSSIFAALKGVIDSGILIPHSNKNFPSDERIQGKDTEEYAKNLTKERYEKLFSAYLKKSLKPEEISKHFQEIKQKILSK